MQFTFGKLQSNAINLGDKKETCDARIACRGMSVVEDAMKALAKQQGFDTLHIVRG